MASYTNPSETSSAAAASKDNEQHQSSGDGDISPGPPQAVAQPPLKCPRCDSPNTKFCYYNNYSLSQPRYFCKACRRYWTRGGALRNVPVGGGCRKNKRITKTSSSSSSSSPAGSRDYPTVDYYYSGCSAPEIGGLRFLPGGLGSPPVMDFQLGGMDRPGLGPTTPGGGLLGSAPLVAAGTDSGFSLDLPPQTPPSSVLGFNFNFNNYGGSGVDLATSIESLSSINQDLHWRLQQQRLGLAISSPVPPPLPPPPLENLQVLKPQPVLFQNLEISRPDDMFGCDGSRNNNAHATEWFFGTTSTNTNNNNNNSNNNNNNNSSY